VPQNVLQLQPDPKKDNLVKILSELGENKIELKEWQASLLNSIGIPSLAFKASNELLESITNKSNEQLIRAMRQKAQALFHLGKYRDSAALFHKASLMAKKINNYYLEADLLLDVSEALRSYGSLFRSNRYTQIAWRIAMKIRDKQKKNRLLGKIFLRKVLLWRYPQQMLIRIKLRFLTQWINRKIKEYLQQACSLSLKTGNWFDFYQSRLLSDRMKIPINIAHSDNYYEPPPTKDAYTQLGYYITLSIHTREQLKQNKGALTNNEEESLYYFLKTAKSVKNAPEIWKTAWLGIKRDRRWRRNTEIWKDFFYGFFSCQYTIGMRIFKLIFGE